MTKLTLILTLNDLTTLTNIYLFVVGINNNNFRVSNIRVSNGTLIYNVCPEAALT